MGVGRQGIQDGRLQHRLGKDHEVHAFAAHPGRRQRRGRAQGAVRRSDGIKIAQVLGHVRLHDAHPGHGAGLERLPARHRVRDRSRQRDQQRERRSAGRPPPPRAKGEEPHRDEGVGRREPEGEAARAHEIRRAYQDRVAGKGVAELHPREGDLQQVGAQHFSRRPEDREDEIERPPETAADQMYRARHPRHERRQDEDGREEREHGPPGVEHEGHEEPVQDERVVDEPEEEPSGARLFPPLGRGRESLEPDDERDERDERRHQQVEGGMGQPHEHPAGDQRAGPLGDDPVPPAQFAPASAASIASPATATVFSISASVWAVERNPASNAEGAKNTPRSKHAR